MPAYLQTLTVFAYGAADYYPSDEFYTLCDEYGILLWEDLMYACNIYDVTPEFAENIAIEAKDNILRFRNHACLGLICGNNELECAWTDWKDARDMHRL